MNLINRLKVCLKQPIQRIPNLQQYYKSKYIQRPLIFRAAKCEHVFRVCWYSKLRHDLFTSNSTLKSDQKVCSTSY